MKLFRATTILTGVLVLFGSSAFAQGDFSPTIEFGLSDTRVKANPQMTVKVVQEAGEEELQHVTLTIPKGFTLPGDEAIANDDQLGAGTININVGPGCRGDVPPEGDPAKARVDLPATLNEKDRTEEQIQSGIWAVWNLDISGVTNIDLAITGSVKTGWKLDGDIPPNDNTCPPFSFDLNINSQSTAGVPILVNPKKPGKKVFTATFTSLDSPTSITLKQPIKITK
jgi:hypothetical protein